MLEILGMRLGKTLLTRRVSRILTALMRIGIESTIHCIRVCLQPVV